MVISVVVPVYNVEPYLCRCIDSILQQTFSDFEVLLIDDGSTDRSGEICDQYTAVDRRVRVRHQSNGGLSDARNAGISMARGDYILFVDSDDYLEPNALEELSGGIGERVDIILGGYKKVMGDQCMPFSRSGTEYGKVYSANEYLKKANLDVVVWGNLLRRQYLLEKEILFKKGYIHEDNEIFPRLYLNAEGIVATQGCHYRYMVRAGSIQTGSMTEWRKKCLMYAFEGWMQAFSGIEDDETREKLYNFLITCYLNMAHDFRLKGWRVKGLDLAFCLRHAPRFIIKLKAIWFTFCPDTYFRVRVTKKRTMYRLNQYDGEPVRRATVPYRFEDE